MAILIPTIGEVLRGKVKPEEGELHLLHFLEKTLDDSFEVYFNPYMNGDRPDVIIMRKNQGALIIEVKDYDLRHYSLDDKKNWNVIKGNNEYKIKSPLSQVLKYKDNLFELHIENLLKLKIDDIRRFNIVSCAIYFHKATGNELNDFLINPFSEDKKYLDFLHYNVDFIGRDNLTEINFTNLLKKRYLISQNPSFYFTDEIHKSFQRFFKPPLHLKEDGVDFHYSPRQTELIYEKERKVQRVKGVFGSGKTVVLAGRAVQAHKRTNGKVLILTYNITLKNYIKDKISNVRENFPWDSFVILNYHHFISSELNNLGVVVEVEQGFDSLTDEEKSAYFEAKYYSNTSLFENFKESIRKYDAIFIDEIQDYKREWMEIVKNYFLVEDGEYVLFGDVKQNIYDNTIDSKDVATNIPGRPSELKRSFRSDFKIKDLAVEYQKEYFSNKYEIDELNIDLTEQLSEIPYERNQQGSINYIFLQEQQDMKSLYNIIYTNAINKGVPPNDITILGETIKLLRDFDAFYRYSSSEKTNTMFESNETIYKLGLNFVQNSNFVKEGIELIKREKNYNKAIAIDELSQLLTIFDLYKSYGDVFEAKFDHLCTKFKTTKNEFLEFLKKNEIEINKFRAAYGPRHLSNQLNTIRNNKKLHFYMNSGTIKLSTVHSFKGWESDLLFLIIEKVFPNSEFSNSFEEIIYTGLTRCRSNLIILNIGNNEYHSKLKELVEKVK